MTWSLLHHLSREGLDRACCNDEWFSLFPEAAMTHIHDACSDHVAVLLASAGDHSQGAKSKYSCFRFEAAWLHSEDCKAMIEKAWEGELGELTNLMSSSILSQTRRLLVLYEREETMWKQRGNMLWLNEGDRNTSFFHGRATESRQRGVIEEIVACIEPNVSEAMNEDLIRPFTSKEVKLALDATHPLKSPVPNAFLKFATRKGLRQGDPLSPYLFLFYAKAFSGMLRKAEKEGAIRGVRVCRGGQRVTHLLFTYDKLIFCDANREALELIRVLLAKFESGSGLQVNYQKCAVVFSRNGPLHIQEELTGLLRVVRITKHDKYLGLPSVVGR
ncbi:hypothetical protein Sango_2506500 [Sesamum angolense]|uniref:Reverse transcriptase domain-containing protein n=1 Tax=Sesamum angolense TaxID=2727404 RepID=A0AAE2BI82_9LAMI|nr:hypothetical protein Sango_2506500 [Sesamum angolense]